MDGWARQRRRWLGLSDGAELPYGLYVHQLPFLLILSNRYYYCLLRL